MRSKVLVTRGAKYLGSVLVPELLFRGYSVTVIDSFLYRQQLLLECCFEPHFRVIRGDAREVEGIAEISRGYPIVCQGLYGNV